MFLRGEPFFLIIYLFARWRACYGVTVHFKLRNIMLVATKEHVILRNFVALTWMLDKKRISVGCDIMK